MDDPAGRLRVSLTRDGSRWQVAIRSSRPLTASRVFIGKPLVDTARQIPLLYSLCSTAQAQAFATAAEAILGFVPDNRLQHRRTRLLQAELIKEHLWRLLLDWPPLLGLAREEARMAQLMATWHRLRTRLRSAGDPFIPGPCSLAPLPGETSSDPGALTELVELVELMELSQHASLGQPAAAWLCACETAGQWWDWARQARTPVAALARALRQQGLEALGQSDTALLTHPDLPAIAHQLSGSAADAFTTAPSLNGRCQETSPLARMASQPLITSLMRSHGSGLLTRFAALLVELAQTLAALGAAHHPALPILSLQTDAHTCLAAVPAARGLLVHRLVAQDGRVEHHQVLAPTEWNFHPRGTLAQALSSLPPASAFAAPGETDRRVRMLITAIDPCVDYSLRLDHVQ